MTAVLVFFNMLLRVVITIVLVLLVLWVIGILYGFVASALGVPYDTAYSFVTHATNALADGVNRFVEWVRSLV